MVLYWATPSHPVLHWLESTSLDLSRLLLFCYLLNLTPSALHCIEWIIGFRTFQHLWRQVGENFSLYKNVPRLIGELGGKNYHLIHQSADLDTAAAATIRSAFEYSGQKCSACSRMYIAQSIWPQVCIA